MTLAELFDALSQDKKTPFIVGDAETTLAHARAGTHPDPLIGEMIQVIVQKGGCSNADCVLPREQVITALGPIRLRYMADDAPVAGFRLVQNVIVSIDNIYNEEALREKIKAGR